MPLDRTVQAHVRRAPALAYPARHTPAPELPQARNAAHAPMEVLHGNDDNRTDDGGRRRLRATETLQRAARPFEILFPSSSAEASAQSDRAARHAR
jgi:hypothetical protein